MAVHRLISVFAVGIAFMTAVPTVQGADDWISGFWVGQLVEKKIDAEMRIRGFKTDGSFGASVAVIGLGSSAGQGKAADLALAIGFTDGTGITLRREKNDQLTGIITAADGGTGHLTFHRVSPLWDYVTGTKDCDLPVNAFNHSTITSWIHLGNGESTQMRVTGDSLFCSNGFVVQVPP